VGLAAARGEYVFFADHDDWLEPDALGRLYAAATEHAADIVIGKVVGHGGRRTPNLSAVDRHGLDVADVPLGLLTPHKLFRRSMLEQHGIRFPEGEQRLEDHLFVVPAFFAAARISVLVSRPVYHWVLREDRENASYRLPAPDAHLQAVRELLDIVDARTEPGPVRDRYHVHWYRGKVLLRLGTQRDDAYRAQVYDAARALILERFPPRLDEALAYNLRLRARLARRDDAVGLEGLVGFESKLRARARVVASRREDGALILKVTGRLRRAGRRAISVVRWGERMLWAPPPELAGVLSAKDRDLTGALDGEVGLVLRSRRDETEWALNVESRTHVPASEGILFPRVSGRARIDPLAAAGGGPLPSGDYDVRAVMTIVGFSAECAVRADGAPLWIRVSPDGRITASHHIGEQSRSRRARLRGLARSIRRQYRYRRQRHV
jgi:glycosyltransferase involved in cell wall biosynthesis